MSTDDGLFPAIALPLGGTLKPLNFQRLLLFDEHQEAPSGLLEALKGSGFEVTRVRSFVEAVPQLKPRRCDVALVYLPEPDFVRNTFLAEASQEAPELPVVALAPAVTQALREVLARFGVRAVLPAATGAAELVRALREALAPPLVERS